MSGEKEAVEIARDILSEEVNEVGEGTIGFSYVTGVLLSKALIASEAIITQKDADIERLRKALGDVLLECDKRPTDWRDGIVKFIARTALEKGGKE